MHPVNIAVVKVEAWLEGRKVEIAARVAADGIVPAACPAMSATHFLIPA
jgi:hypothetical protein